MLATSSYIFNTRHTPHTMLSRRTYRHVGPKTGNGDLFLTPVVTLWSNAKQRQFVQFTEEQSLPARTCWARSTGVQYVATTILRAAMDIAIVRLALNDRQADLVSPTDREIDSSFRKQILAAATAQSAVHQPQSPYAL